MSLEKAIKSGKEWRKEYGRGRHGQCSDGHGNCDYCNKNLFYNTKKREAKAAACMDELVALSKEMSLYDRLEMSLVQSRVDKIRSRGSFKKYIK